MSQEKRQITMWDRLMMAVTFAEAGEHQTSKSFLRPDVQRKRPDQRIDARKSHRPELRV